MSNQTNASKEIRIEPSPITYKSLAKEFEQAAEQLGIPIPELLVNVVCVMRDATTFSA